MKPHRSVALVLTLVVAVVIILLSVIRVRGPELLPSVELTHFQAAAAPLAPPPGSKYDARFQMLSVFDQAVLPCALVWDFPLGSQSGAWVRETRGFLAAAANGQHLGVGLCGLGATSAGMPVFAAANGMVVYCGVPDAQWGSTLVVAHRDADGRIGQTIYAPLAGVRLRPGAQVTRGQMLGTLAGTPGGPPAQLHFAVRADAWAAPGELLAASGHANQLAPSDRLPAWDHLPTPELLPLVRAAAMPQASFADGLPIEAGATPADRADD